MTRAPHPLGHPLAYPLARPLTHPLTHPFALGPRPFVRWCVWQLLAIFGAVSAAVAAHLWAASVRCGACGIDLLTKVQWDSVWLWTVMILAAASAYRGGLAWIAREERARLSMRLLRDGSP